MEQKLTKEMADQIFQEGTECETEITISEATQCVFAIFSNIMQSSMVKIFKKNLEQGYDLNKNLDALFLAVAVSVVATLLNNFEEPGDDA